MLDVMEQKDYYENSLRELRDASPEWLKGMREKALARFAELGYPTTRQEGWRFTPVKAIAKANLVAAPTLLPEAARIDQLALASDGPLLVIANGRFCPERSRLAQLPKGVTFKPLSAAWSESEAMLGRVAHSEEQAFTALNTALQSEGALIQVAAGALVEQPLEILHLSEAGSEPHDQHVRVLVDGGENSEFAVVESFHGKGVSFTNSVTEVRLAKAARAKHFLLEYSDESAWHVHALAASQERDANLQCHSLLVGGALVRYEIDVVYAGEGAETLVNGLFVGHGKQLMDINACIDHAKPHNNSKQFIKGILDGKARGVFTGRVIVREDAQKTDSSQSNRNLLLSKEARVDTQPQLEIYADDVKCAHGATTGQLDEDALFYLQARGVNPELARDLLVYAFAHEVIDRMPLASLRERAESFLFERFATSHSLGGL